jgi:hypothetical protein
LGRNGETEFADTPWQAVEKIEPGSKKFDFRSARPPFHYKKIRLQTILRGRGLAVVSRLGLFQRPASVLFHLDARQFNAQPADFHRLDADLLAVLLELVLGLPLDPVVQA